ncbi:MAG: dihydroorotate dehydrogenase-like protein [Thermodesulfobacteriota bacterium]|jgi:dihydroorotate dehydrogenase (fumarate)
MDLSTTYLGLKLSNPLIPGASPLTDDLGTAKRLEDAGAPALVLPSLFEEQIENEQFREVQDVEAAEGTFAEALTYFPRRDEYRVIGPDRYLEIVRKVKEAAGVPVIASLNGVSDGTWVDYARLCQEAGADALELNVYLVAADPDVAGSTVEDRIVRAARAVKTAVRIPVAVKLSPYFSSLPHMAKRLEETGADGLVLFNRFYQPEIDPEALEVVPKLRLSDSSELLLRLRWLAILSGRVNLSLGATGGAHTAADAVKAIMAGAHGVQMVSALLRNGPAHLTKVRDELSAWMEAHGYESVAQMRGCMNLSRSPNPAAFERANYIKVLQGGVKRV